MKIVIGSKSIYADEYTSNPKEKSVMFYRKKDDLDYIPPIKIAVEALSDFGRELLQVERLSDKAGEEE